MHGLDILRINHTMIKIMVSALQSGQGESVFDKHTSDFASIIEQNLSLWDATGCALGDSSNAPCFNHYFTAMAELLHLDARRRLG